MLELRAVTKTYRDGEHTIKAADRVSLTVAAGELVALFGPSGSGKTTLLLIAAGIAQPDAGQVLFCGRDVGRMPEREATEYRLRQVGVVFQSFHLIPGASALDNAAVKLLGDGCSRRHARRRARPWLDRVGLGMHAHRQPATLSGGERQRVAIARALANDPKLVLADEPTGNLDSASGHTVLSVLADICHEHGVGVVLATHDAAALDIADRSYVLRDGALTEDDAREPFAVRRAASEAS